MNEPGRRLRVAVLMGGTSSERPISLSTGKMILSALDPAKYEVAAIDTQNLLTGGPIQVSGTTVSCEGDGMNSIATGRSASRPSDAPTPSMYGVPEGHEAEGSVAMEFIPSHEPPLSSGELTPSPQPPSNAMSSPTTDLISSHQETLVSAKPDVVFIALHGKGGEDGTVQGMLELMGLPYTGSGVLASALAMDKGMTKRLFRPAGIPVLEEVRVRRGEPMEGLAQRVCEELGGFPVFVKPNAEGSTFGCSPVEAAEQLEPAVVNALKYDNVVLIEPYVRGMEITVGVLGNAGEELEALPIIEIIPKSAYYDYESKYADGGSEHIIPARLSEEVTRRAQAVALQCHELLGCRGMSRTDMLVVGERFWVLEVNTIPGMTPTSLLPQAAAHAGISFSALLDRIIASAL